MCAVSSVEVLKFSESSPPHLNFSTRLDRTLSSMPNSKPVSTTFKIVQKSDMPTCRYSIKADCSPFLSSVALLLDWLSLKVEEPSLPYYLLGWGSWIHPLSQRDLCETLLECKLLSDFSFKFAIYYPTCSF